MNVTYPPENINEAKILVIRLRFRLQVTVKNKQRMNKYRKESLVDHGSEEVLIYRHGKNNSHEKIVYASRVERKSIDFSRSEVTQDRILKSLVSSQTTSLAKIDS